MKWPKLVPFTRGAKQCIYVRELTYNYVRDNPNLTYHEMQFCIDRIDHLTRFIEKRSIDEFRFCQILDLFHVSVEMNTLESSISMLAFNYNLSRRQIKFLLRKEMQYEKRTGTN